MVTYKRTGANTTQFEEISTWQQNHKTVTKYFVSLPSEEAHHNSHQMGGMHTMAPYIHPKVIAIIHELVGAAISKVSEVEWAFKLMQLRAIYIQQISLTRMIEPSTL